MNAHVPLSALPALQRSLSDVVAEYEVKRAGIPAAIAAFEQAGRDLKSAATVGSTISNVSLNVGNIRESDVELSLRKSAWLHVYEGLHIEVLADASEERPDKPRASTAVARDLQYYPTPVQVVEEVLSDIYIRSGQLALEPSCGCGRIMTGLRKAGAIPFGVEVDAGRVSQARAKGFDVRHANFLECEPAPKYDHVVMNPPFYGKHYFKHIAHALKFLKADGRLTAILPITARYDHHLLDDIAHSWRDLPVGSFSESGINVNTTVLTAFAPA